MKDELTSIFQPFPKVREMSNIMPKQFGIAIGILWRLLKPSNKSMAFNEIHVCHMNNYKSNTICLEGHFTL